MASGRTNMRSHGSQPATQLKAKNVPQLAKKAANSKTASSKPNSTRKESIDPEKLICEAGPNIEGEWHQVPCKSPRTATSSALTRQVSFESVNPFTVLNNDEEDPNLNQPIEQLTPPPIYVKSVTNLKQLCEELVREVGNKFSIKAGTSSVTVMPSDSDAYRKIIRYLKERKAEYHSYQLPEERPMRVVIRNLHHTLGCDLIKTELEELGFHVLGVHNVFHPKSKVPLPIFFIDLQKSEKSGQIFSLKYLYYTKIKVEEPKQRNEIPQCKRCQSYGHTRTYCNLKPRCVKCAGPHLSSLCKKPKEQPAKCALCEEAHPANYRGCSVHKELKKIRQRPPFRSTQFYEDNGDKLQIRKEAAKVTKSQYVMTTFEPPPQPLPDLQTLTAPTLPTYSETMTRTDDKLITDLSKNVPDITTQLTNFINDFKNLISPLITLLTSLMQQVLPILNK